MPTLSPSGAIDLAATLKPSWDVQAKRVAAFDAFLDGTNAKVKTPNGASPEVLELATISATNYGNLAVSGLAQTLIVGGFRNADGSVDTDAELAWQRNRMRSRQNALHRTAIAHSEAYVVATLGVDQLTGQPMPHYECYGPDDMALTFADQAQDEWPMYGISRRGGGQHYVITDDEGEHWMGSESRKGDDLVYVEFRPHAVPLGLTPIVRYANVPNIKGVARSKLTDLMNIIRRIDQTEFDRLVTQRYNAFRARWIAGIEVPEDVTEQAAARLRLLRDALLVFEDDTVKTGSFDASDLAPYQAMREDQLTSLISIGQLSPHSILGLPANLGVEALQAANEAAFRALSEAQLIFGEAHLAVTRLGHALTGNAAAAADYNRSTHWEDTEVRSLAQTADALGKLSQMVGVPAQGLWPRIPNTSAQDLANWAALAEQEGAPLAALASTLNAQAA